MALAPLHGDPSLVRARALELVDAADKMSRATAALQSVADGLGFAGESIEALRDNATEMQVVLRKAEVRYRDTGHALVDYSATLDAAQAQAKRAISMDGSADVRGSREQVHRLELEGLNPFRSDDEKAEHDAQVHRAASELAENKAQAAQASALYHDAKADVEHAAAIAMERIQSANEASALNDSFWDNLKGFYDTYVSEVLKAVIKVLDVVGDILGAISLVLLFVPGLQVLAAALGGLALALKLVVVLAMIIQGLAGERPWKSVLKETIKTAATALLHVGKLKALGNVFSHKGRLINQMDFTTSRKFLLKGADMEGVDYKGGAGGVFKYAVGEGASMYDVDVLEFALDPEGYIIDHMAEGAADLYDSAGGLDGMWTVDAALTHDTSGPVGSDFSGVSTDAILERSFSGAGGPPAVVCSEVRPGGGGGGGGW